MKVLLLRDLLKTAHHFPPYHIGSPLGAARFRGDYRFPKKRTEALFGLLNRKPNDYPKKQEKDETRQ